MTNNDDAMMINIARAFQMHAIIINAMESNKTDNPLEIVEMTISTIAPIAMEMTKTDNHDEWELRYDSAMTVVYETICQKMDIVPESSDNDAFADEWGDIVYTPFIRANG